MVFSNIKIRESLKNQKTTTYHCYSTVLKHFQKSHRLPTHHPTIPHCLYIYISTSAWESAAGGAAAVARGDRQIVRLALVEIARVPAVHLDRVRVLRFAAARLRDVSVEQLARRAYLQRTTNSCALNLG